MFKNNWEKASVENQLPQGIIEKMILLAYPNKKLISYELIAGGCANINFKILFEHPLTPMILRVYLRDENAAYREQLLSTLLKQTVPAPLTYYIGEVDEYHFAITEFIPGISLRDLLLSNFPYDLGALMYEVGVILSNISKHEFAQAGFFDKDLQITHQESSQDYLTFAKDCLDNETIISVLGSEIISNLRLAFDKYGWLFPDQSEKNLVHGDFDPANIFVNKVDDTWKVTGVLDWEFAFSGSVLWDVANMLRYAYKMPTVFQDAFLNGLSAALIKLPENWHTTIQILNLLALLDCLKRADSKTQPNKCKDIREVISYYIKLLSDS